MFLEKLLGKILSGIFLLFLMLRSGVHKLEGECQGLKRAFCQRIMDLWPRVEVSMQYCFIEINGLNNFRTKMYL